MTKRKNAILILIALILFLYTGFITIYPKYLASTFNKEAFEESVYKSTALRTTVDNVSFSMKPDFTLVITIRNWSSKYVDYQDCIKIGLIEFKTNPFSVFTKKFTIRNLYLKKVRFSNQTLPNKENKLAYLPASLDASAFGTDRLSVTSGPVEIRDLVVKNIARKYYQEDIQKEVKYNKAETYDFLKKFNFANVDIN